MNQEIFFIEDGVEVAAQAWNQARSNRYGSIPDLPDDELADPDELERCVLKAELEPVLLLPKLKSKLYSPAWDMHCDVDFNAFASVDFGRLRPEFDKARYKADKLKEQLKDVLITIAMLNERIKKTVKYKILKLVRLGHIEADQIKDFDMWQLAKYYMRALKLSEEIRRLRKYSRDCRKKQLQEIFDSLG